MQLDIQEAGPYTCGHRMLTMTYTPPGGLPPRTIPVHVWYPSTSTEGEFPRYRGIFVDEHAREAVPPLDAGKAGLPVLVHSHGYKGFSGNSARLLCHFATHGWLSVAPEHVGNTIADTPEKLPLAVYVHRIFDMHAALDFVAALPAEDALSGKADMERVAMSGHSFGTYTAWALAGATLDAAHFQDACQKGEITDCTDAQIAVLAGEVLEKRGKVAMPLAGAPDEVAAGGWDAARVPVLMMSGSLDKVGDDKVLSEAKTIDLTWTEVEGGCHQLFGLGNSYLGDEACKQLDDEEGFSLVNPWALAFARYHVLGDRSEKVKGLVEGATSLSSKIQVKHLDR